MLKLFRSAPRAILLLLALLLCLCGCREKDPVVVYKDGICEIPANEEELRARGAAQRARGESYFADRAEEEIGTYLTSDCALLIRKLTYGSDRDRITCYVADVYIRDMSQFLGYVCRDESGNPTKLPAQRALDDTGAPLLINADFLTARKWGLYVRGGETVRSKSIDGVDLCLIGSDGVMKTVNGDEVKKSELLADENLYHIFSFGPSLLNDDGSPRNEDSQFHITDKYSKWNSYDSSVGFPVPNPRTAFGQAKDGHFIFITVDGRMRGHSRGATFPELSHMMYEEGAVIAYNLDGGGSEIMCFKGEELTRQYSEDAKRTPSDYICILPYSVVSTDRTDTAQGPDTASREG